MDRINYMHISSSYFDLVEIVVFFTRVSVGQLRSACVAEELSLQFGLLDCGQAENGFVIVGEGDIYLVFDLFMHCFFFFDWSLQNGRKSFLNFGLLLFLS